MINLTKTAVVAVREMVKGRNGYGVRVKGTTAGCSGLYFDLTLDKKKKGDVTLKKHGDLSVFADKETKKVLYNLPRKNFKPATIDHAHTSLGKRFLTESHMVRVNFFEHDLE